MSDFDFDVVTGPIARRDEKPAEPPVAGATAVPAAVPEAASPLAAEGDVRRTG